MIDKLMKYNKSWKEFNKWCYDNKSHNDYEDNMLEGCLDKEVHIMNALIIYVLHGLLIEWLDSKQLCLIIDVNIYEEYEYNTMKYCWKIFYNDAYYYQDENGIESDTRNEATEAGIIKSMELLEAEQISKAKK